MGNYMTSFLFTPRRVQDKIIQYIGSETNGWNIVKMKIEYETTDTDLLTSTFVNVCEKLEEEYKCQLIYSNCKDYIIMVFNNDELQNLQERLSGVVSYCTLCFHRKIGSIDSFADLENPVTGFICPLDTINEVYDYLIEHDDEMVTIFKRNKYLRILENSQEEKFRIIRNNFTHNTLCSVLRKLILESYLEGPHDIKNHPFYIECLKKDGEQVITNANTMYDENMIWFYKSGEEYYGIDLDSKCYIYKNGKIDQIHHVINI